MDGTSDRIVSMLEENVFRLNFDMWSDYKILFTPERWEISSPSGHVITSESVTRSFFWKPFHYQLIEDKLIMAEIRYTFRELHGWCKLRGINRGTSFNFHDSLGKLNILSIAKNYFEVPKTLVTFGLCGINTLDENLVVAKSLSSEFSNENKSLMTTLVNVDELSPYYPWYLQKKIESNWDVTIFQCGEVIFPFKRSRLNLKGLDWRTEQEADNDDQEWFPLDISTTDRKNLFALSSELKIDFGRYDFMLCSETNKLIFLEYNANGQWVFLDYHNQYGLLDQVVKYLK